MPDGPDGIPTLEAVVTPATLEEDEPAGPDGIPTLETAVTPATLDEDEPAGLDGMVTGAEVTVEVETEVTRIVEVVRVVSM
jgi:hypothetical protein